MNTTVVYSMVAHNRTIIKLTRMQGQKMAMEKKPQWQLNLEFFSSAACNIWNKLYPVLRVGTGMGNSSFEVGTEVSHSISQSGYWNEPLIFQSGYWSEPLIFRSGYWSEPLNFSEWVLEWATQSFTVGTRVSHSIFQSGHWSEPLIFQSGNWSEPLIFNQSGYWSGSIIPHLLQLCLLLDITASTIFLLKSTAVESHLSYHQAWTCFHQRHSTIKWDDQQIRSLVSDPCYTTLPAPMQHHLLQVEITTILPPSYMSSPTRSGHTQRCRRWSRRGRTWPETSLRRRPAINCHSISKKYHTCRAPNIVLRYSHGHKYSSNEGIPSLFLATWLRTHINVQPLLANCCWHISISTTCDSQHNSIRFISSGSQESWRWSHKGNIHDDTSAWVDVESNTRSNSYDWILFLLLTATSVSSFLSPFTTIALSTPVPSSLTIGRIRHNTRMLPEFNNLNFYLTHRGIIH